MDPITSGQSIGALAAPWAAAALALVPTGLAKVRDPLPAVRAMRAVGLPSAPLAVRAIGVAAVAIVYASFLVVSELPGAISAYRAPREDTRDPARPAPAPRFELGMR